jgi:hypothetical protein
MGKLIVTECVTLDGVAQAPGAPDEDRDGGFVHGGWQAPLEDQGSGGVVFEQARSMDALLLGRRTYEVFADYWPKASEEIPLPACSTASPSTLAAARSLALSPGRGRRSSPATSLRASPPSRTGTTKSTSSAASTSCSHCCASASSTG